MSVCPVVRRLFAIFVFVLISSVGVQRRDAFIQDATISRAFPTQLYEYYYQIKIEDMSWHGGYELILIF